MSSIQILHNWQVLSSVKLTSLSNSEQIWNPYDIDQRIEIKIMTFFQAKNMQIFLKFSTTDSEDGFSVLDIMMSHSGLETNCLKSKWNQQ